MNLREAVSKNPYKIGCIAAAIIHSILRLASPKKSSWVGSGGYYGLLGILIPFLVEKKSTNATVKLFAVGWRNTFIFLAIGENLYYAAKTMKPDVERPILPVLAVAGASAFFAIKAESKEYVPMSSPGSDSSSPSNGQTLTKTTKSGEIKTYEVKKVGKNVYTVPVKNLTAAWLDKYGKVIELKHN